MKKILLSIFLVMLTFSALQAQRRNGLIGHRIESTGALIFTIGPSYSFADPDCSKGLLGSVINQKMLQNQSVSLGYRTTLSDDYGYKVSVGYDHFTGSDILTDRNYSFETDAFQMSGQAEYYYHFGRKFRRRWPNTVYGFLGLGVMTSNAILTRPTLDNRGGYKYRQNDITPIVPIGVGYKYDIGNQLSVGVEFWWRYTFSDYLDGFKPRYSRSNDELQGFSLTVSYQL